MPLVSRVISSLLLIGAVAGCTPSSALWSEADARKDITVHRVELVHDVAFDATSAEIAPAELRRLDQFLTRQQVGYGDTVEIHTPGQDARIDARRASAVTAHLARGGIAADRGAAAGATGVRITVARSVAVAPACPDWRKPSHDGDPSNTPMSNLGCATAHNLSLMIADPSELVAGRSLGPASGDALAAGVARYRAGETKPLPVTESPGGSK